MSLEKSIWSKYFIAIIPDEKVYLEIQAFKEHIQHRYESRVALRSPPHLTLHMPFQFKQSKQDMVVNFLENFARIKRSLSLRLDGFGGFPPKVIFVHVEENDDLKELQKDLAYAIRKTLKIDNSNYKNLPFRPHITIAFRDLKKVRYEEAWSEFQSKPYQRTFDCNSLALLRHDGKMWEVVHQSTLMG